MRASAFAAVCAAVLIGGQAATAAPPDRASLQKALDRVVAAGAPGAVLLVRDGNRELRLASGDSMLAGKVRAQPDERFRIGGVTVSFVATVALQLVAEKKLHLTDTVEKWLPGKIPTGAHIDVRQLLQQTAGLHEYLDDPTILRPYQNGHFDYQWTPEKLLPFVNEQDPDFQPGKFWKYSNSNYLVLGLIVEAVTGKPLSAELKRRLFDPLGLRQTSLDSEALIKGPHLHSYGQFRGRYGDISSLSPSPTWAAGAIVSSTEDVARFYRALLQGRLLPPKQLRAMESTVSLPVPYNQYGLGLWSTRTLTVSETPLRCGPVWGHPGDWDGYTTLAFNSKDGNRQFVLAINGAPDSPSPKLANMMLALAGKALCGR
jgi:D-alanyl-D-alanine carboxypeptidase